ncbi:MAG: HAD hydrolase-like protein, partial [Alphaproteobacteria bacterium]
MTATPGPRLAVFDCDGTLVDSQHTIVAAIAAAWRAEGLEPPGARAVRRGIGLPLIEAVARLLPEGEPEDFERLARHYKAAFSELRRRPDHEEPLFPG